MAAAHRDIAVISANFGLFAVNHRMRPSASTRRFIVDFRPQWQTAFSSTSASASPRSAAEPGKQFRGKVGPQAVAQALECSISSAIRASCSTCSRDEKLRLVNQDAGQRPVAIVFYDDIDSTGRFRRSNLCASVFKSDARCDIALPVAIIERSRPDHRVHSAFAIIEIGLQ
jgi:hypothetical protein